MAKCSNHGALLVFFLVRKSKSKLTSRYNVSLSICFNVCMLKKLQQIQIFTKVQASSTSVL